MDIISIRPLLAVLMGMAGAFFILLAGERHKNIRESSTILASVAKFLIVLSMVPFVFEGKTLEYTLINFAPGLLLQFRVDSLGIFFGVLASFLWVITSTYSIGYMRSLKEHAQTRYFFCFAIALSATMGIAFAGNLLTLFIFYEILTVSTYPLVAHKETAEAIKAGRKYLAYTLTGGAILLFSIAFTYHLTGRLDFVGGGFLEGHGSKNVLALLFITFILGFGIKAAIMPLHEWLPTAMIAPIPVSALLHAVAVVKAGVFGCLRVILYVFGPALLHDLGLWLLLAYFVSFTIIVSGMIALAQDNLKARLAFSTINSLSIVILGVVLLSPSSVKGGILHIANHAFMKITLFFCAGAVYVKTHKEKVSELDGIGRQMPFTMGSFAIGAMGLAGIPPICGFISKWYLCLGTLEAREIIFLFVLLTSALMDVAYFFPIIYNSFFKKSQAVDSTFNEAPWLMLVPIMIGAIISIILGIAPDAFVHFFKLAALTGQNTLR